MTTKSRPTPKRHRSWVARIIVASNRPLPKISPPLSVLCQTVTPERPSRIRQEHGRMSIQSSRRRNFEAFTRRIRSCCSKREHNQGNPTVRRRRAHEPAIGMVGRTDPDRGKGPERCHTRRTKSGMARGRPLDIASKFAIISTDSRNAARTAARAQDADVGWPSRWRWKEARARSAARLASAAPAA